MGHDKISGKSRQNLFFVFFQDGDNTDTDETDKLTQRAIEQNVILPLCFSLFTQYYQILLAIDSIVKLS